MQRTRASEKRYKNYRKSLKGVDCQFCVLVKSGGDAVIAQTKHCLIIVNRFGYDIWDGCGVKEHLMVIPKRHVVSLAELNREEKLDYMDQLTKYEGNNYSLYARSPGNTTKSVTHQHSHLIKIDNKYRRWFFYLRSPHITLSK